MGKTTHTIDYRVGEKLTLDEVRFFIEQTKDVDGAAAISVEVEHGQLDARYYHLVIREES